MNWQPGATAATARARAQLLNRARAYFLARNVLEVATPALTRRTATDPNIESLVVSGRAGDFYLHTSPEHYMKRLLAAGYPDIFQICNVFRDGESGRHHLPEFTMIEWYQAGLDLQGIMAETEQLARQLFAKRRLAQSRFVSYTQAFAGALQLDPLTADVAAIARAVNADTDLQNALGQDRDAWLDLAMATRVAPSFPVDALTLVYHYPASQAALARLCSDDERFADRFELYCGAVELANGFVELLDADEQAERFERDRQKRSKAGLPVHDADELLLAALRAGIPPCAGVALGLDRLLMLDENCDDIRSVTSFVAGA